MALQIQAPDGSIAQFPDGTADDVIVNVMRKTFGGPQQPRTEAQTENIGIPKADDSTGQAQQPRVGDFLKPTFGGHNPVAETYDVVAPAVKDVARLIGHGTDQNFLDAAGFGADVTAKSLTIPSLGSTISDASQRFAQGNPGVVHALEAIGSVAPGVGAGAPNLSASGHYAGRPLAPRAPVEVPEAVAAAERQGIELPRGAASDSKIVNGLSAYAREVPFAGAPLENAVDRSVSGITGRLDEIKNELGGVLSPETVGQDIAGGLVEERTRQQQQLGDQVSSIADQFGRSTSAEAGTAARDQLSAEVNAVRSYITNSADVVANSYGRGSVVSVGEALRDTLNDWIKNKSGDLAETAYADVGARISKTAKEPLLETRQAAGKMIADAYDSMGDPPAVLKRLYDAVRSPDGLSFDGLSRLRSEIGSRLNDHLTPSLDKAPLKQAYGALTQDLERLVANHGGKEATAAWQHANDVYKNLSEIRDHLSKIVGLSGDASGEAIVSRIEALASSGGRGDIHKLVLAKQAAGDIAWDGIASAIIKRAGSSHDSIAKMDAKLSENGRQILFAGTNRPELAKRLRSIAQGAGPGGRLDQVLQQIDPIIGGEGAKSGEAVLERLHRMAESSGGADIARLKYVKQILDNSTWNEVSGAMLRKMSKGKNGEFDHEVLRANVAKISPEGHDVLFNSETVKAGNMVKAAAETAGPDGALAQYISTVSKIIGAGEKASGEAVVDRLIKMGAAKDGADYQSILTVREALPAEIWDHFAAAMLDRMGKTKDENVFSIPKWRTEFSKISQNSKAQFFRPDHLKDLEDINTVGGKLENIMKGNTSKTAIWGKYALVLGGSAFYAPWLVLQELAGSYGTAWFLARPARAKTTASWLRSALKFTEHPTKVNTTLFQQSTAMLSGLVNTPDREDK